MRSRVIGGVAAMLLALTGVAACGDDEPTTGPGADGSSAAGSSEPDTSPSAPSASTATAEPATGKAEAIPGMLSFRLTTDLDWRSSDSGGSVFASGSRPGVGPIDILADDHYTANTDVDVELKYHLRTLRRTSAFTYRRLADRSVADVEGYVIAGKRARGYRVYEWGTIRNGRSVLIEFTYNVSYAGAEDTIEAVLASVEWQ